MCILDLDLDFFQDHIQWDAVSDGPRLSSSEFTPWSEQAVRHFLENQCGLSRASKIPGKIVTNHHEAFFWWRDLLVTDRLSKPFEVVHVDAHADLGSGTFAWTQTFVGEHLLNLPANERENPQVGSRQMNAGNYLVVAIACGWLSRLTFVAHSENECRDVLSEVWLHGAAFAGTSAQQFAISLPRYRWSSGEVGNRWLIEVEREPPVPFDFVPHDQASFSRPFEFVVLAQSPGFTPETSDALIPVIKDYLTL